MGLWFNFLLGHRQTRFYGQQNSSSEDPNQAYPKLEKFCSQSIPLTWFCRPAKLLVKIIFWALCIWTWSVKIHVLVVANPSPLLQHSQIPSGWAQQILLQSSWCRIRVGAPTEQPTMLKRGWFCPQVLSHWRSQRLRGNLSVWCSAGLGKGQCGQCVAISLTFLM